MKRRLYTIGKCLDDGTERFITIDYETDTGLTKEAFKAAEMVSPLESGVYQITGTVACTDKDYGNAPSFCRDELKIENQYLVFDACSKYIDIVEKAEIERLRAL
tara:strand:+ start:187 stop:498 length:312 start_codon:yes stop_codon:yes gene_type:complete